MEGRERAWAGPSKLYPVRTGIPGLRHSFPFSPSSSLRQISPKATSTGES